MKAVLYLISKGEFIGLNISFFGQTHNYGMGFSISINQIQKILPYLMKNKPIKRAFLGIIAGDLSQETKDFLKIKHGVIANNIIEGQAAEKFGIKTGDIILSIDDIKVNNSHHLIFIISSFLEEKTIKIKILRDNKEITLEVKLNTYLIEERDKISLEKNDNTSNKKKVLKWLGLHLIENKKDVQIKEIEKNSQASKATVPLKPGDIILSINLKEVNSIKFFSKIDHRKSFLIRVKRDNFEFFSLIKQK